MYVGAILRASPSIVCVWVGACTYLFMICLFIYLIGVSSPYTQECYTRAKHYDGKRR